jgi:hypothetical protein
VKVGVGDGVAVAVGLGGTVGVAEAVGVAETIGVFVASGDGTGCEVQALKRMSDREMERKRDFMRAIMAETEHRVKRAPLFDIRSPLC